MMLIMKTCFFLLSFILHEMVATIPDGIELCQITCGSIDNPFGNSVFCQLGCQQFYNIALNNQTCKAYCNDYYRYETTCGNNFLIDSANEECEDGCQLAYKICQGGFYCINGSMIPCPLGTYRTPIENTTDVLNDPTYASVCTECPYGTYRSTTKGVTVTDCELCPIGTYSNMTGRISIDACLPCPAGQFTSQPGSRLCECITPGSCEMKVIIGDDIIDYFHNGVDYFRETVPYIGR